MAQAGGTPVETAEAVVVRKDPHLFAVLAEEARRTSRWGLFATMVGGIADAVFVTSRFGSPWLASAFVAMSCYGMWGLIDRELVNWLPLRSEDETHIGLLQIARGAVAGGGVAAVLYALAGFMGAALHAGFPGW